MSRRENCGYSSVSQPMSNFYFVDVLQCLFELLSVVFFLMIRRQPRPTQSRSSAASDVYKGQHEGDVHITFADGAATASYTPVDGEPAIGVAAVPYTHLRATRPY